MTIFHRLLDFVLPTSCAYCNAPVGESDIPYFCSSCWNDFSPIGGPVCPRCGKPFESPEALAYSSHHECSACRQAPPAFDQALSVGYFEGPLREAVHQFKYRPCRSLGRPLGEWMAERLRLVSDIDVIIPVPLHAARLRSRGFNQALLLAYHLSGALHIPLSYNNLIRVRQTRPQVELTGAERVRNVAGAFALKQPGEMAGKRAVLVDDVFTTGATLNECAAVLKAAGAAQAVACTLTRAV
ncbi:MAG TPA: ComF family protein [Nitrospirota bacterium]